MPVCGAMRITCGCMPAIAGNALQIVIRRPFHGLAASRTRSGFGGAPTIFVVAFAEMNVLSTLGAAAIRRAGALRGAFGDGLCLRRVFNRPQILRDLVSLMRSSSGGITWPRRRARNLVPRSRIVMGPGTGADSRSGKSISGDSVTALMFTARGSAGSTTRATIGAVGVATGARGSVALTSGCTASATGVGMGAGGRVALILGATLGAPD